MLEIRTCWNENMVIQLLSILMMILVKLKMHMPDSHK